MSGWINHSRWIFECCFQFASTVPFTTRSIAIPITIKIYLNYDETYLIIAEYGLYMYLINYIDKRKY
jgi:hypothetical protein